MQTELNSKKPGSNIDCWGGKCKMMLAHTIEAMVGDKPARVQCNTCKSQHGYKASPPGSSARRARATDGDGEATAVRRPAKGRASRYQLLLNAKSAGGAKTYSPSGKYEEGDVL